MVKCAALNCKNYARKKPIHNRPIKFHRFPKDPEWRKQWLKICDRRKNVMQSHDGICSDHFDESDYQLKDLLLNVPIKKRRLKEGAVPKLSTENLPRKKRKEPLKDPLSLHEGSMDDCSETSKRPERKWVLTELVVEPIWYRGCLTEKEPVQIDLPKTEQEAIKTEETEVEELNIQSKTIKKKGKPGISESMTQVGYLGQVDKAVQTEIEYEVALEFRIMHAEAEARKLKTAVKKVIKMRRRQESKEAMLKKIFTPGQLKRLREPNKKFCWSNEDQIAARELYLAGIRSYNMLRERGIPLPAGSQQRKWASKTKAKLQTDLETQIVPEVVETELVAAPESVSEVDVAMDSILPPETDLSPKFKQEPEMQIFWSEFMNTIE